MRAFHAVALGCIPVIIQDDGSGKYPSVLQAFEGLLLDWSHFGVRLRYSDLPQLPSILRADASGGLPIHRVLTTDGLLVGDAAVPNQRALLLAEGVALDARGGLARDASPWWAPSHEELFLAPP